MRVVTNDQLTDSKEDLANETVLISMALDLLNQNSTDGAGYFWNVTWNDADGDGLVSTGDSFQVVTNYSYYSSYDYQIAFFDLWALEYTGEMYLPGFGPLNLLGSLAGTAVVLKRRRGKA